jgi:hypothetical protein
MFIEKKRIGIPPRALTANGTANGLVQVADIRGFYVKQKVYIRSNTQSSQIFEIKRFDSLNSFYVGPLPPEGGIGKRSDISAYLVADSAVVGAEEQDRPGIKPDEHERAVYVEEPIVAKRVINVDEFGQYYNTQNPVPVQLSDGSIDIGTVNAELEVQLSHKDNDPDAGDVHDSVRIGDGADEMGVNPDGSINVVILGGATTTSGLTYVYSEVLAIPSSVETDVLTVTVPPLGQKRFQKVEVSGTNVAEVRLKINSIVISKKRIWHTKFNVEFDFENFANGLNLLAGDVLKISIIHTRPMAGDFNATAWYI